MREFLSIYPLYMDDCQLMIFNSVLTFCSIIHSYELDMKIRASAVYSAARYMVIFLSIKQQLVDGPGF